MSKMTHMLACLGSKYLLLAILSFNPAPRCRNYIQQPVIMFLISSNGI